MPENSIYHQGHEWNIDDTSHALRYIREVTTPDTTTTLLYYPEIGYMEQRDRRGDLERVINLTTEEGFDSWIKRGTTSIHLQSKPNFSDAYVHIAMSEDSSSINYTYHNRNLKKIVIGMSDMSPQLSKHFAQQSQETDPTKLLNNLADLYESDSNDFFVKALGQQSANIYSSVFSSEDAQLFEEKNKFNDKYREKIRTHLSKLSSDLSDSTLEGLTYELLVRMWLHPAASEDASQLDNPEVFESLVFDTMSEVIGVHYDNVAREGKFYVVFRFDEAENPKGIDIQVEKGIKDIENVEKYPMQIGNQAKLSYAGEYTFIVKNERNLNSLLIDTIHGPTQVIVPQSIDIEELNTNMRSSEWSSVLEMVQVSSG